LKTSIFYIGAYSKEGLSSKGEQFLRICLIYISDGGPHNERFFFMSKITFLSIKTFFNKKSDKTNTIITMQIESKNNLRKIMLIRT
jgi:hypothetical protein